MGLSSSIINVLELFEVENYDVPQEESFWMKN